MDLRNLHRDEILMILFLLAASVWAGLQFAVPASRWFSVQSFAIHDAARWQDVTLDYRREIRRPFVGEWTATVRRQSPNGWEVVAATPVTRHPYKTDSTLPEPVTLEWVLWTEPRAYALPCGRYEVTIVWVIKPESRVFRREVSRTATFTIWGDPPCTP